MDCGSRAVRITHRASNRWGYGLRRLRHFVVCILTTVILGLLPFGMAQMAQTPNSASVDLPKGQDVIAYLNQMIDWHRQVLGEEHLSNDATDVLFLENALQISNQALHQAFDFAKDDAQLLAKQKTGVTAEAASGNTQSLTQAANEAAAEVQQRKIQSRSLQQQLARAGGRRRQQLQTRIQLLQSEIELEQARSDTLQTLLQFAGGQTTGGVSLLAQIAELQRSVPELESGTIKSTSANNAAPPISTDRSQPSGVIGLIEDLFALRRKTNVLDNAIRSTDALSRKVDRLRQPLVSALEILAKEGDQEVENPADAETNEEQRLDALTAQFKQISAIVLPLGKQSILFTSYRNNLESWKAAIGDQYSLDIKRLVLRLTILVIALVFVIILAELWRSAIFRYVHDMRRRYQFLLLRRIIIWIAIAITIAFALASEIGSIATFVGLITAGVAVALQNVILAIAGYFFLIGKYGVRVGDRVQIAGVTGDVVDIGLIRLHLMEVSSVDTGRQPTGRVVVFSNAVVFQPGASFFKQIPGTSFTWHQMALTLAPETDYRLAEKRIVDAVNSVYAGYREHMEAQHQQMQDTLNVSVDLPKPQSRLQFTDGGLEIVVRFPAELDHAAEIDDEVTRKLVEAIEQSPRLKLVGAGTPNIQPVADSDVPQTKAS